MAPVSQGVRLGRGAWALVQAALVGAYLEAVFFLCPRNWPGYGYIQFLFDYAHGPARRSLEGEIARHLVAPPYTIGQFQVLTNALLLAALLLFVVVAWRSGTPRFSLARTVLVVWLAASPLTFKNLLLDQGRLDVLGVFVLELTLLLGWAGSPWLLAGLLTLVTVPLALCNENLLLLHLPAALAILGAVTIGPRPGTRRRIAPFAAAAATYAAACLLCVLMPKPNIPQAQYRTYLEGKSLTRLPPWDAERWPYSSARDNFAFARAERTRLAPLQRAHLPSYLLYFALLCGAGLTTARSLPAGWSGRGRYLAGLACTLPGYAVLMWGASDLSRWCANLTLCTLALSLFFRVEDEAEPAAGPWWLLVPPALFQLLFLGGFGVNEPSVSLGAGFHWLVHLVGN